MSAVAILALGPSALTTAQRVRAALEAAGTPAEVHGARKRLGHGTLSPGDAEPARYATDHDRRAGDGVDRLFDDAARHLAALFAGGYPIVGVCAAGILIRSVAPMIGDKASEPPVIAVAEDGSAVVPLLGAHRGGLTLARIIADALGVAPAVTTAGDVTLGVALDDPPPGWSLAAGAPVKQVTAALLAGAAVEIDPALDWLRPLSQRRDRQPVPPGAEALGQPCAQLLDDGCGDAAAPSRGGESVRLVGSIRQAAIAAATAAGSRTLSYVPRRLALGVGCERGCAPEHVITHAANVIAGAGIAPAAIACVVSIDRKADEPAVHGLAEHLGVPARFFGAAALDAVADCLRHPSETVRDAVGVPGVAEAAALVAAGPAADLIVPKRKTERATAAIADAGRIIVPADVGRARGRLSVVGIGPGGAGWRTEEAHALLAAAEDWVGYRLYLDLAGDLRRTQTLHAFPLGTEEERVRFALERAGEGRDVALISSGDPGIYAMASLVFELLAADPPSLSDAARRIAIEVAPGVSAAQAAAARLGAPLGHDFAFISLSDLLTPWPEIERRLDAAAAAGFVVALYNPRSEKRDWQIGRALEIFRRWRGDDTAVAVAASLGRAGERLEVASLGSLDASAIDMLSVVLIGASGTRTGTRGDGSRFMFTPRGYAAKRSAAA